MWGSFTQLPFSTEISHFLGRKTCVRLVHLFSVRLFTQLCYSPIRTKCLSCSIFFFFFFFPRFVHHRRIMLVSFVIHKLFFVWISLYFRLRANISFFFHLFDFDRIENAKTTFYYIEKTKFSFFFEWHASHSYALIYQFSHTAIRDWLKPLNVNIFFPRFKYIVKRNRTTHNGMKWVHVHHNFSFNISFILGLLCSTVICS